MLISMEPFEWVCLYSEHFIVLYNKECPFLRPFFTGLDTRKLMDKGENS